MKLKLVFLLPFALVPWFGLGTLFTSKANALPGQRTDRVIAWIKAHPTLRPSSGETLLVRKSDTAAVRFIFQASVLSPGLATPAGDPGIIRTEQIDLFDTINGVTANRLEESLRVIYGLNIYQDYQRAQVVYAYPNEAMVREARGQAAPLQEALQGQLRLGDRYAYWLEIAQPRQGFPITGKITILLKSDLDKLESELRNR